MTKRFLTQLFIVPFIALSAFSQPTFNNKFEKIVFGCYAKDINEFEDFVKRARASGATHINLSNEDLPFAKWEYDTEGDPYPSWVFTNMGLLKIATPAALKPYLPQDYAERVMGILEARCKVLRKHGLKASFKTFEPQMLPEKVFTDHPLWRGPRVDHPNRSRVARWAPDIDNPEVLALYGEALALLLKRCPEIDILSLTTNDSGTGLSWSRGLYSGASGNVFNMFRRTDERLRDFFSVFQEASKKTGNSLDIDIYNTREYFPEKIAENLSAGMAIENIEGPDKRPFKSEVGFVMDYYQVLYPVVGIPDPIRFIEELESANQGNAKRLFVLMGDRFNKDLYFDIYDRFNQRPSTDIFSRLAILKEAAEVKAGNNQAMSLLNVWLSLQEVRKPVYLTSSGGTMLYLGCVQQRWLTRPFVPFPEELRPEDRDYYRKFLFQARTEEHANNLADLQAAQIFSGWGGMYLAGSLLGEAKSHLNDSRNELGKILNSDLAQDKKKEFQLLDLRLQALELICNNAGNAVSYQAQIDRAKELGIKPDPNPVISTQSGWDRNQILETARFEIDNTALLIQLLENNWEELLDIAPVKEQEDIRRFGPDLVSQLKQKLRIMNEHWLDYNRIFTVPNL